MTSSITVTRRHLLRNGLLTATLLPLATRLTTGHAAEASLLSPDDPAAKKLQYTDDATKGKGIPAGNTCANCVLYQGSYGSTQGPCQAFAGKQVKAAGWCSSWAPQM